MQRTLGEYQPFVFILDLVVQYYLDYPALQRMTNPRMSIVFIIKSSKTDHLKKVHPKRCEEIKLNV